VSIRPECWVIGREQKAQNCIEGVIGNAVYLGGNGALRLCLRRHDAEDRGVESAFYRAMAEGKLQAQRGSGGRRRPGGVTQMA